MPPNAIPMAKEKAHQLPRQSTLPTLLSVAGAVVSLVTLLLLVQTSGITTTGYDVRRLEQERDDWQQVNYQLEAEIARFQSLDRIEKEAKGRLQMAPATDYVFVTVRQIPASAPDELSPPSPVKRTGCRREDESWSQRLLDWLGSALGLRQG